MRIGSLCTGYGGLDMAAQAVLGGETAWVSDIDKGANKLLAHRYPDVPNLGDFTCTDWSAVEPVDVLTAGFPCQPVSHAGKRLGTNDERWLWDDVARAVRELRPGLVLLENVRGLLTAGGGRLFGRVVGALADLGYDAQWHGLRAADVGAPHGRWRVFIVATPADNHGGRQQGVRRLISVGRDADRRGGADGAGRAAEPAALLPTPVADNSRGLPSSGTDYASLPNALVALLPTPAVNDMGEGKTVEAWDEWTARMKAAHGNGNGHGASLAIEAQRLLPTPRTQNNENRQSEGYGGKDGNFHGLITGQSSWGQYADAIARWENLTRPAPPPTETGPKGNPRLSPAFSEWLMGVPDGWITDVPGITRNEALKLAGNGVVWQQAEAALRLLLDVAEVAA